MKRVLLGLVMVAMIAGCRAFERQPVKVGEIARLSELGTVIVRNPEPVDLPSFTEAVSHAGASGGWVPVSSGSHRFVEGDACGLCVDRGLSGRRRPPNIVETKVEVIGEADGQVLLKIVETTTSAVRIGDWSGYYREYPCPVGTMFFVDRARYDRMMAAERRYRREDDRSRARLAKQSEEEAVARATAIADSIRRQESVDQHRQLVQRIMANAK